MNATKIQHKWATFLKFYSDQNEGRKTRLGVFENADDVVTDYWLESGLPLIGIDIDTHDEPPSISITVGNFTHEVKNAVKLAFKFGEAGDEDGVDVSDASGRMTILRFE